MRRSDPETLGMLRGTGGSFAASAARLSAALTGRAQAAGLLDVAYRTLASPVGPLLLAATETGLVRIAFATEGHEHALQQLADRVSPRVLHAPARLDRVARELDEYFAGARRCFELPLDLRLARGFRLSVLHRLTEIEYGQTVSYGSIAIAAGSPRAVRAVGSACATNPIPLVVPCHRVLRSDGSLGGYGGGLDAKRTLLALEDTFA
jgi:methylated-DNA-[protein]-cysteine S-methyltransferase